MATPDSQSPSRPPLSQEDRVRLLSELANPYRGLRKVIYGAAGASAGIGAFIFLFRALAGRDLGVTLPSLALQLGVLATMIALLRWESQAEERKRQQFRDRLK